jgi:N-succinyldiaminopimelate aminotransferase
VASQWKAGRIQSSTTTIFAEMSALAVATGSVNLGQGFPDTDGPAFMLEAAEQAIAGGVNQYPPGRGIAPLRQAISAHSARHYGLHYDPDTEVLVTTGATEALASAILAFVDPGDEVIALEPFYDSYAASIHLAGGTRVGVGLFGPDFGLDIDEFAAAFTPRTKALLINSPHNPTGTVLEPEQLAEIARLAVQHDVIVICDEVYEHLTFDDARHVPLATFPGMRERTVRISSSGKTFSATGWKIGWALAVPELIDEVTAVKQFLTYVSGAPFQPAIGRALNEGDQWVESLRVDLQRRRDRLADGLRSVGLTPTMPRGTYFMTTDVRPLGYHDGVEFCRDLPTRCGVVAIPHQVFYDNLDAGRPYVRWAFCKRDEVIDEAIARLAKLA